MNAPPPPSAAELAQLEPDAAIYAKAAEFQRRFPEGALTPAQEGQTRRLEEEGRARAKELRRGHAPWATARGFVARGYGSAVDGSVQPYGMYVPAAYDAERPMRLDVILHGRTRALNEIRFLSDVESGAVLRTETGRRTDPECLKLYVFGRGNTSYRWAGETDVFEALAEAQRRYRVDPERIVLRGFSMGGTGAWHLGLHFPSRWAAVEAGAGFVETRPEVLKTVTDPWRRESLAIHDAANCADNLTDVPFLAYVGSRDPQREENAIIRRDLAADGVDPDRLPEARFLIGEGAGHNVRPESKQLEDEILRGWLPRHRPASFRFVAYTPAYGRFWDLQIETLERLYRRAEVAGTWDRLTTRNVLVLAFATPRTVTLDGETLKGCRFEKVGGRWRPSPGGHGLSKQPGLQGPIDDAFQAPFLAVAPAGPPDPVLEQMRIDFARHLRGDIRVKAPEAVTAEDIAAFHLVLFGTPDSNPWIARVLPRLPVHWTRDTLVVAGHTFAAADVTLALIYPNPLNPARYVVLNSGPTYPGSAFDDLHWYLHPRLGDFAVLDRRSRAVRLAGFFDAHWQWGDETWSD